ncbi:MAG: hypothetical protein R6V39_04200 [Desulfovibrionales bacterium]
MSATRLSKKPIILILMLAGIDLTAKTPFAVAGVRDQKSPMKYAALIFVFHGAGSKNKNLWR